MKYFSEKIDELDEVTTMQEDSRAVQEKLDSAARENKRLMDIIEKLGINEQEDFQTDDLKEKLAEYEELLNEERKFYSRSTNKLAETINRKDEEIKDLNIKIAKSGMELNNKSSDVIMKNKRLSYMAESLQANLEKKNSEKDDLKRELMETESFLKEEITVLRENLRAAQRKLFSVTRENKKLLYKVETLKFELSKKNAEPDKLEKETVESESPIEKKADNIKTEDLMEMTVGKDLKLAEIEEKLCMSQNAANDVEQISGGVVEMRKELEDRIRALESKKKIG